MQADEPAKQTSRRQAGRRARLWAVWAVGCGMGLGLWTVGWDWGCLVWTPPHFFTAATRSCDYCVN